MKGISDDFLFWFDEVTIQKVSCKSGGEVSLFPCGGNCQHNSGSLLSKLKLSILTWERTYCNSVVL